MGKKRKENGALTVKTALGLAAPQTWAASVIPALVGAALSVRDGGEFNAPLFLSLAAVCVLMQSAVNTFNDYSDFIRGNDTLENSPDADEAVMLYDKPSPKKVLALGFAFLLCAALCGIPAIVIGGFKPLLVGAVGAFAVLLYSFGKKPLSYLPLGELVSGLVMGGLIPLGVYGTLTGDFSLLTLVRSLPVILGVALIMLTNNGCDIGKDSESGRGTLAVALGERKTAVLYRALIVLWLALPPVLLKARGAAAYLIALLPISVTVSKQLKLRLGTANRPAAMGGISNLNITLGMAYALGILLGGTRF